MNWHILARPLGSGAGRLILAVALSVAWAPAQTATGPVMPTAPVIVSPLPDPTVPIPTAMNPDLVAPAAPDNYLIGPGDLLSVFVYQMPDLTRQVRVSSDGTIALPLLAQRLPASKLTAPQLSLEIRQALVSQSLARSPLVQTIVREVNSRPIVISGAVRYPGVIQANRPMSLLEVLSRAGGLSDGSGTRVLLTEDAAQGSLTRELSVRDITDSVNPESNIMLHGGETVRVLPARLVYAVGSFQKPGGFPIQSSEQMTVLKVVALAQGVKDPANKKGAEILRQEGDTLTAIPVNLDNILHHKAADQLLEAGDVFFLPDSVRGKWVGAVGNVVIQSAAIAIGYTLVR